MRNGEELLGSINVTFYPNGPMRFTIWRAKGFNKFAVVYKGGGGTWSNFDRLFGLGPIPKYDETYEC